MRVEFSKEFEKAVRKLSGKMLDSVRQAVQEVINAGNIEELTDCKKLVDYEFIYRLRIGSYRAFFSYHVQIVDDCVMFLYLALQRSGVRQEDGKEPAKERYITNITYRQTANR